MIFTLNGIKWTAVITRLCYQDEQASRFIYDESEDEAELSEENEWDVNTAAAAALKNGEVNSQAGCSTAAGVTATNGVSCLSKKLVYHKRQFTVK